MFPGFVDLQVNGLRGVDFTSGDLAEEGIASVEAALYARGTVGYCPTVVTSSIETYAHCLPLLAQSGAGRERARNLGIHLEGPFISPDDGPRGVHPRECVTAPTIGLYERLRELAQDRVAIVTLAPEISGALELIRHIVETSDTVVSLGHTAAGREDVRRAVDAGARLATHVGNGMADTIHRHHNPLWPLLADDRLACAFITDGFHLPPDLIRVALRTKGAGRFLVTSDVVHLAGMAPGPHEFHGVDVVLEPGGHLHRRDAYQLAGSACDMLACMNHLAQVSNLTEDELGAVACWNPLRLLGTEGLFGERVETSCVAFREGRFAVL